MTSAASTTGAAWFEGAVAQAPSLLVRIVHRGELVYPARDSDIPFAKDQPSPRVVEVSLGLRSPEYRHARARIARTTPECARSTEPDARGIGPDVGFHDSEIRAVTRDISEFQVGPIATGLEVPHHMRNTQGRIREIEQKLSGERADLLNRIVQAHRRRAGHAVLDVASLRSIGFDDLEGKHCVNRRDRGASPEPST